MGRLTTRLVTLIDRRGHSSILMYGLSRGLNVILITIRWLLKVGKK